MTTLVGPFDALDATEKRRVQAGISTSCFDSLFHRRFTMRGAQDKITASLLDWFDQEMSRHGLPENFDVHNEDVAQRVLSNLYKFHVHV